VKFTPLEHQRLAIDWLKVRQYAALFAGMGLGKSASVLAAFDWLMKDGQGKGLLIIAPLRVAVLTWPHEVQKWDNFRYMKLACLRTKEGLQAWEEGTADIYTLNYEQIPKFCKNHLKGKSPEDLPVDTVVWDELSKAKNPSAKRINGYNRVILDKVTGKPVTRVNRLGNVVKVKERVHGFRDFRGLFTRHWGLTGTPTPNSYLDLFAQIRLLDDGQRLGTNYTAFKKAYFEPDNIYSQYPKFILRPGAEKFIQKRVADMALTLRSEDWLNIPPTVTEDIEVSLPRSAWKVYKELQKEFLAILERETKRGTPFEVVAVNQGALIQKLLQATSGAIYDEEKNVGFVHDAKIKALVKLQKDLGEPLLVATKFRHEQTRILQACPGAELFTDESLERWQKGKIKFLVSHPLSIGHGVDGLQHGGRSTCWFSQTYSPEEYNQWNARLARTGQDQETRIFRLTVPGTFDDAAIAAVEEKHDNERAFLAAVKNLQELAKVA
jgi:SNF2 family DNA or RNA helicase